MAPMTKAITVMVALVLGLATPAAPAAADSPPAEAAAREFLDNLIPEQLRRLRIPGAVVTMVADGKPLYAKGYGLANIAGKRPFHPDRTTFPIDSVSKLITATAVMQLVEGGKLDLDGDVNRYLTTFKIRDRYPGKPVTLAHLLTHTAGFEDPLVTGEGTAASLGKALAEHQPERVRPPGTVHSYSDYGLDLAGYLVEIRSGMPFQRYVDRHVFAPLGMTNSTFAPSAVPKAGTLRATGYTLTGDGQTEAERGDDAQAPIAPSVGMVSTAADMTRFLLALLGGGAVGQARILKASSVQLMQRRSFGHDPLQPGVGLPFFESDHGGVRLLGHSGEGPGSHSLLTLEPKQGIGLFVSYNGDGAGEHPLFGGAYIARAELLDRFAATFFPGGPRESQAATQELDEYVGTYRWTKFAQKGPAQLFALLSTPDLQVIVDGRGGLTTTGFSTPDAAAQHWRPVGRGVFTATGNGRKLGFVRDENGDITLATTSYVHYAFAFQRISWYESVTLHLVAGGAALVLMVTMAAWPIGALVRRRPASRGAGVARWIAALAAILLVSCVGRTLFPLLQGDVAALGKDGGAVSVLLKTLVVTGTALTALCAIFAWRYRWWGLPGRVHFSVLALGIVTFLGVAANYSLLG